MALFSAWSHAASITLTWDGVPGVSGYRLYRSFAAAPFESLDRQSTIGATVTVSTTDSTRFYVVSFTSDLTESNPSNVVTNVPAGTPPPQVPFGSVFEAEAGTIAAPFYTTGTGVKQDAQTDLANGGRASYFFAITNGGTFTIKTMVAAPDEAQNSFFVNVDAEPTEANIWDVPLTSGVQQRFVQWRGETNAHAFTLATGNHTLVFRGREGGVELDKIEIMATVPTPPVPPPAPTNLRLHQLQGNRRDFGWDSGDRTASSVIEKSIESDPFTQVAALGPGVLHWVDTRARQKVTRYRVKSCKSLCSTWSEITFRPTR